MKISTVQILELVEKFYRIAAKLQLEGPGFPQDPNFTGIVNVSPQKHLPVEVPEHGLKHPKELSSGVLPVSGGYSYPELIVKMSDRLLWDIHKLYMQLLDWAPNPKNPNNNRITEYKQSITVVKSLQALVDDIHASFQIVPFKEESIKKQIEYLNDISNYFEKRWDLFKGINIFRALFIGLEHLKDLMGTAIGSMPGPYVSSPTPYDMFAQQDAEEDAEESGEQIKDLIDEDPPQTEEEVDSDKSLSFNFEPLKF